MPSLAAMAAVVVAEEQARRRPVSVAIRAPAVAGAVADPIPAEAVEVIVEVPIAPSSIMVPMRPQAVPVMEPDRSGSPAVRLTLAPTTA